MSFSIGNGPFGGNRKVSFGVDKGFSPFGADGGQGRLGSGDVVGTFLDKQNPMVQSKKAADKRAEQQAAENAERQGVRDANVQALNTADDTHYTQTSANVGTLKSSTQAKTDQLVKQLESLITEAQAQGTKADATYTNTILPALEDVLSKHKANANSAMTLEEAMDPNNKLATSIRDLYDNLGQRERQRGQQDYGVLAALGAQAAGQQFGQLPMTSGQMGQIYARNQTQAGDAYARAQQRMYDLQQQGITRGFEDTKHWYDKGQQSIDKYGQSAKDIQTASTNHADLMGKFRGERANYGGQAHQAGTNQDMLNFSADQSLYDLQQTNTASKSGRETASKLAGLGDTSAYNDFMYGAESGRQTGAASFYGGLAQLMSAAVGSDKRIKTQVGDIKRSQLKEFFSAIKPKKFRYKNPNTAITRPGQRYGFMMQDVANTQLGKAITQKMPDGTLAYDRDNLQGILVAALADNYRGKLKRGRKVGH